MFFVADLDKRFQWNYYRGFYSEEKKHWGVELSSLLAVQRGSELGGAFCRQGIIQQTAEPHLSGNDGYFWDCGLCKSKKQFGSVSDDASVLLSCACWEKTQQFYWIGVQTIRFSTGGLFSLIQLTGESLVVKLNRLNHELQHGKHALHITAACVYMHEDIIQEYLAGSLAHPQTWWWECWKHHRSEQIGLPSLRSWCPNSLTNKTSTKWIEGCFF